MGSSQSAPEKKKSPEEKYNNTVSNVKKLFENENDNVVDSLQITEFEVKEPVKAKEMLPGFNTQRLSKMESGQFGGSIGGSNVDTSREVRIIPDRHRYLKYDIFDQLEMKGGDQSKTNTEESNQASESIDNVKNVVMEHLNNLKQKSSQLKGGNGCGCESGKSAKGGALDIGFDASSSTSSDSSFDSTSEDSSSVSWEYGKTRSKSKSKSKAKSKAKSKSKAKYTNDDSDSNFIIDSDSSVGGGDHDSNRRRNRRRYEENDEDDSSSDEEKEEENERIRLDTSNEEDEEDEEADEGLSIFPFNSSDVKSSVSSRNFKNLRRRV